ncbi:hypothetical protein [Streptomyces sp. AcE210]|uniref:hypothetical protein n=1 Tax=Streptomyces sp. AcE210 TaxID=2292703 RepID=UPI000E30188E|nr:hypothetical protein [Streptomyces sp. AcE210]RFC71792.1 hypothetical protein DXZ75_32675 [Streptomyces sp. AcE210]
MSRATTRCTVLAAAVLGGILWAVPAQALPSGATGHGAGAPKAAPASADDFVWPTPPARPLDFVWPSLPHNLPGLPGIPSSPDDFVWPVTPQR